MNSIEEAANKSGYMSEFISNYELLWRELELKREAHEKASAERNFFNAIGLLNYFTFDTLYGIYCSVRVVPAFELRTMSPCFELPFFMGAYVNLISLNEYLVSILAIARFSVQGLTRADFGKLAAKGGLPERDDTKLRNKMLEELKSSHPSFDPSSLFVGKRASGEHERLRHWMVHRFRPLWWRRPDFETKGYGFPSRMLADGDGIDEEVWRAIQDAGDWNEHVGQLSAKDFISAQDMLLGVHKEKARLANAVWGIALEHLRKS